MNKESGVVIKEEEQETKSTHEDVVIERPFVPESVRNDPAKYFEYMTRFH